MTQKKRNGLPEDDDGRTIADMNVDGMPWYTGGVRDPFRARDAQEEEKPPMSREERRGYIWAALKASLLIGSVFVAFDRKSRRKRFASGGFA